jgi:hypothetical protein
MYKPLSVCLVCSPSNRDSPGLKGLSSCLVTGPLFPCPNILRANLLPVNTNPSTARSFATWIDFTVPINKEYKTCRVYTLGENLLGEVLKLNLGRWEKALS